MSYREHTILYKELGSLLMRFSAKFEKQALRSFGYIFNIKIIGFIILKTINIRNRTFKFQA